MKKILIAALLSFGSVVAVQAAEATQEQQVEARLVSAFGPRLQVREVGAVAGKQLLEVVLIDGSVMHMTPDMNYFLYRDELYQLTPDEVVNVTQSRLNPKRVSNLSKVTDQQSVLFAAKGKQKALINVFTDIDCGFCQKLHLEVPRLNELGIAVRYLAYPRAGINSPQTGQLTDSYQKLNYVWCAQDRTAAMTAMKNTQRDLGMAAQRVRQGAGSAAEQQYRDAEKKMQAMLSASKDCNAPITAQFELGHQVGVTGTPAIITEDGTLIPGYMPADELARRLGIL